jgi:hypothetical protein
MPSLKPYWLTAISILGFLLVRLFLLPSNIINPDCSMFLKAGQLVLAGARPYIDFVELNPPLVFYIHAIPASLSRVSGLSPETSLYIFTLLLFAVSLLLCWNLLKGCPKQTAVYFGPIILAFCLGNVICYEWVQFGQRQQLIANALLPFCVCRYLRWHGTSISPTTATISGLLCGIMTCLLPQYAAIVVSLEMLYIFRQWRQPRLKALLSPETISFLASILAYGLFVLSQESLRVEFLGRWLPMVSEGYALYNWPWQMQITQLVVTGILPACTFSLLLLLKRQPWKQVNQENQNLLPSVCVFCLGSAIALLLQGKCILNQTIPLMYGSLMLCCSLPSYLTAEMGNFKRTVVASSIALLCFLTPVYGLPGAISQNRLWQSMTAKIASAIDKESTAAERISVLSLSLPDSYPALTAAKRESGNRYFFVFPMLMTDYLAKKHTGTPTEAKWQAETQKFISNLESDLHTNNPRIVFIQENTIPTASISVRKYLEKTSFWQSLNASYDYAYPLKTGVSELSVWRRR